jgi:hypothetical protein
MKKVTLLLCLLGLGSFSFAVDRKTLFLDKMEGFEVYIEKALRKAELDNRIELIEEVEHPDLKAVLGSRFTSIYAEALYQKQTGLTDNTRITLVDVKTKKQLLTHDFKMTADEAARQRAADEFVKKLRDLLLKK